MEKESRFLSEDFKPKNVAQEHQEEIKKRVEDDEVENPDRREALKTIAKTITGAAAAGFIAAAGGQGIGRLWEKFSKNREEKLRSENPLASEIQDSIDSISNDLNYINSKINDGTLVSKFKSEDVIRMREGMPKWKEEIDFLKKEGSKLRAGEDTIPKGVIFEKLERLEKEISLEVLKIKHGLY